jgi:hypothetical protein
MRNVGSKAKAFHAKDRKVAMIFALLRVLASLRET